MTATLTTAFTSRDFSLPIHTPFSFLPSRLAWSAFGGPDSADLVCQAPPPARIFEAADLLRCAVMITDPLGRSVWWGFVNDIIMDLDGFQVRLSLDSLFNKVSVVYRFMAPDNLLGAELATSAASNSASQLEYGIKEKTLFKSDIDDDFAEALRDTFLAGHAWPSSALNNQPAMDPPALRLGCLGWFHTLDWQRYSCSDGFLANYEPGPGFVSVGHAWSHRMLAQSFQTVGAWNLLHIDLMLRNIGSNTRSTWGRIYQANLSGVPTTYLDATASVAASTIPSDHYAWTRYTFSSPVALSAGANYALALDPGAQDAAKYLQAKSNDNLPYPDSYAWHFQNPNWFAFSPDTDIVFRLIGVTDTGEQIQAIVADCGQFFPRVAVPETSLLTCPFRPGNWSGLAELRHLMNLGTANHRLLLANVTPERHLVFSEQPDPDSPDVSMDHHGSFRNAQNIRIPPYLPPVGRWVRLSATNRISLPWDKHRLPAAFIAGAEFRPLSPGAADGFTTISTL
jgi:hypothetical protein